MANVQRNDPCPCGSGKKFKLCCLNKPLAELDDDPTSWPTWKLYVIAQLIIIALSAAFWYAHFNRTAQVVGGVATLVLVLWAAFRRPPPVRTDEPGKQSLLIKK
ncbi:MAG: SEC-C metal-binding domain-containing protein [Myxococcota bacterium]|jgi:hypothetical protein|nr:SEC-C metal-binding domain-containing protein [Myxococcota bacterium]